MTTIKQFMDAGEYEKAGQQFLKDTNTTFRVEFLRHGKHFHDETDTRDIYNAIFERGGRIVSFEFGNSVIASGRWSCWNGKQRVKTNDEKEFKRLGGLAYCTPNKDFKEPTAYDVLTCLVKEDFKDLKDFCDTFGYDTDSIKANEVYKGVKEEYYKVCMLWNEEELDVLREIQ